MSHNTAEISQQLKTEETVTACAQFQAMLALKKSKLPLTDYKKHWKYNMSQVTQSEHQ